MWEGQESRPAGLSLDRLSVTESRCGEVSATFGPLASVGGGGEVAVVVVDLPAVVVVVAAVEVAWSQCYKNF